MEYRKVSIVIPVFNEAETIEQVIARVLNAAVLGMEKEIVLVDDCSTDGTREILLKYQDPKFKIIFKKENNGKGAALRTGFQQATGDIVIIQDADLEYDPNEIEVVLKPFFENGANVVYGSRYLRPSGKFKFWHSLFNKAFTGTGNLFMGLKITDLMTCYKAFNRKALHAVLPKLNSDRFGFEPEVTVKLARGGFRITEVPISYTPRTKRQGKHMNLKGQSESLWALIKYSLL